MGCEIGILRLNPRISWDLGNSLFDELRSYEPLKG